MAIEQDFLLLVMYLLNAKEDMNQSIRRSYSSVGKYANAQVAYLVTALK